MCNNETYEEYHDNKDTNCNHTGKTTALLTVSVYIIIEKLTIVQAPKLSKCNKQHAQGEAQKCFRFYFKEKGKSLSPH